MAIEDTLERIATALETIAKNGGSLSVSHEQVGEVSATQVEVKADKPADDAAAKKRADAADKKAAAEKKAADDAAAAAKAAEASKSSFTQDDIRNALKAYRDIEGAAAMLEVLKANGADSLAALSPSKYEDVMKAVS